MSYRFSHLYQGSFNLFEAELSRTIPGACASEDSDLYIAPPGITFGLVDDGGFNACAYSDARNEGVLEFYLGVYLSVADCVCTLACTRGFFNEIPFDLDVLELDIGLIKDRYVDYTFLLTNSSDRVHPIASKVLVGPPQLVDESPRGRLGNQLLESCIRFVSYHEVCHYLLGHCSHAKTRFGITKLYELQPRDSRIGRIADLTVSRAFELHADGNAATLMMQSRPGKPNTRETPRGQWLREAKDPAVWAKCVITSVAVVTSIIHRAEKTAGIPEDKRSHPHAQTRLFFTLRVVEHWLREFAKTKAEIDSFLDSFEDDLNMVYELVDTDYRICIDPTLDKPVPGDPVIAEELEQLSSDISKVVKSLMQPPFFK